MSSFGEALRRQRELRRISLREVAEATKINLRYLDALEQNDFEHLPGGVFNKGFVRAYAQYIGVDPDAMVNAYLVEQRSQGGATPVEPEALLRGLASAIELRERGGAARRRRRWRRRALLATLASLLVVVAAVSSWLWMARGGAGPPVTRPLPADAGRFTAPLATPADPTDEPIPSADDGGPAAASPTPPPADPAGAAPEDVASVARPEPGEAEGDAGPAEANESLQQAAVALDVATRPAAVRPIEPAVGRSVRVSVVVDRPTSGRLNCDNRRVEVLDGVPAGTTLRLECRSFLLIDAEDGGSLRVGLAGGEPTPLGVHGEPVRGYRVIPPAAGGAGS